MRLLKFRIKNYKSIIDTGECELSKDNITILAGQNEAGKTAILEALRDFDIDKKISLEAKPDGREEANPEIECEFSIEKEDLDEVVSSEQKIDLPEEVRDFILERKSITIKKFFPENTYSLSEDIINKWKEITEKITPTGLENQHVEELATPQSTEISQTSDVMELQKKLAEGLMRFTPYIVYYESFMDKLPKKKYLAQIENKEEVGYQAVQDFIKITNLDIEKLKNETDDKVINNYLNRKSGEVTGDFLHYWSQKVDGVNRISIIAQKNRDEQGLPYLSFFVKDGESMKYPEQRSKGLLWFLSFYLRLNAESLEKEDTGALILIDEPGSYLHAKAQGDVLKILEKLAKKHQILFSTHSSHLIDTKRLNRIWLVLNKQGEGTKIKKITAREPRDPNFADALTPIITAIGLDLGRQFDIAAKKNVILEGISDYYYLSTLRDKSDFRIPKDIQFIPMSGVFKIEYMVSLMIGWGLEFAIVMDRDENSNKEYEILTRKLNVPNYKIFRLEGGKAIEDMFLPDDFCKFVLGDSSQVIPSNVSISDYIDSNQKIVLSQKFFETYKDTRLALLPDTKERFKKIFDFIKGNF